MWNEVTLIGNIGRDPEGRTTQSGQRVVNLSLATSESWKDKGSGERKERTEWHRIVVWGKLAEVCDQYIQKGTTIAVRGQLRTRKWTDKDGTEKYSTEVVLDGFEARLKILKGGVEQGGHDRDRDADDSESRSGYGRGSRGQRKPSTSDDLDDEIPF
jgi:single-strand DNA-binding protein